MWDFRGIQLDAGTIVQSWLQSSLWSVCDICVHRSFYGYTFLQCHSIHLYKKIHNKSMSLELIMTILIMSVSRQFNLSAMTMSIE